MRNVKILDCTLRDGGRIINCSFSDDAIRGISQRLTDAGIDIVEVGFLRDTHIVTYEGNSTFFTNIAQINRILKECSRALYTAFIDYSMFDFECLPTYEGFGIAGIRVGFTKKQYKDDKENLINVLKHVKNKQYKLFVQAVNTPGYTDREMLELIDIINDIHPYSFGIVDTYGSLYLEDLSHVFELVEHNLDKNICIDIHSHNNLQSSFAFAQEIIRTKPIDRVVILDSTLNGMGKCAGNLNTELIVDYLNRKKDSDYDLDTILDTIDLYLAPFKENYSWGYSIPAFLAGIFKSHPNNIIFLTEKYRINNKDLKYIVAGIEEEKRQVYDYNNIAKLYEEYFSVYYEDKESIRNLKDKIENRNVVILAPGKSIVDYSDKIQEVINDNNAIVIAINFVSEKIKADYLFYANAIHFGKLSLKEKTNKCIVSSNITDNIGSAIKVNYTSLIEEGTEMSDNSTIMLINLLHKIGVKNVMIAGFDGIVANKKNYVSDSFVNTGHGMDIDKSNQVISKLYNAVKKRYCEDMRIDLITPSLYEV